MSNKSTGEMKQNKKAFSINTREGRKRKKGQREQMNSH